MKIYGRSNECFATGVLNMESTWLSMLIAAQLCKVVLLSIWHLYLNYIEIYQAGKAKKASQKADYDGKNVRAYRTIDKQE